MTTKYLVAKTITAWAIPRPIYSMRTDPEFTIKVTMDDNKPYNDGAFAVGSRDLEWEVSIPDNHTERQINAMEETREEEYKSHAERIRSINEAIKDLRALPAPK